MTSMKNIVWKTESETERESIFRNFLRKNSVRTIFFFNAKFNYEF